MNQAILLYAQVRISTDENYIFAQVRISTNKNYN